MLLLLMGMLLAGAGLIGVGLVGFAYPRVPLMEVVLDRSELAALFALAVSVGAFLAVIGIGLTAS